MKLITLFLTCANNDEARKISTELLDKKLAACVRMFDVNSTYYWQGDKHNSDEIQLIIESTDAKFDEIETTVRKIHSYESFVLTAYPVLKSSSGVAKWVEEVTG